MLTALPSHQPIPANLCPSPPNIPERQIPTNPCTATTAKNSHTPLLASTADLYLSEPHNATSTGEGQKILHQAESPAVNYHCLLRHLTSHHHPATPTTISTAWEPPDHRRRLTRFCHLPLVSTIPMLPRHLFWWCLLSGEEVKRRNMKSVKRTKREKGVKSSAQ